MKRFIGWFVGLVCSSVISAGMIVGVSLVSSRGNIGTVVGAFPLFVFFSFLAALAFGTPLFLAFRYFGAIKWWSVLLSGFVVGSLAAACIRLPGYVPAIELLVTGMIGAVSALGFWVVWKRVTP